MAVLFLLVPLPQNSGIEKAFLFDVVSKIYIATDSSPVDMQSYELCCDMIDVVIDVSCIYGSVIRTELVSSQSSGGKGWFYVLYTISKASGHQLSLSGDPTPDSTPLTGCVMNLMGRRTTSTRPPSSD